MSFQWPLRINIDKSLRAGSDINGVLAIYTSGTTGLPSVFMTNFHFMMQGHT